MSVGSSPRPGSHRPRRKGSWCGWATPATRWGAPCATRSWSKRWRSEMRLLSCHLCPLKGAPCAPKGAQPDLRVALVGNPNVGKSSLFYRLTGVGVEVANYPGTTVQIQVGETRYRDLRIQVRDVPGCYSLDPISEDQAVARRALLEWRPGGGGGVGGGTNLEGNPDLLLPPPGR